MDSSDGLPRGVVAALLRREGWLIQRIDGEEVVVAYGKQFPVVHPFAIYAKLFRNEEGSEQRYRLMKAMHDYLWPGTVWHYWTERRFRAHCEHWSYISFAGGASTAKSLDSAKIAILWWLADPHHRGVVVASVSLDSLNSRIWGYILRLLSTSAVPLRYDYQSSKPPKILNVVRNKKQRDYQHGLFAIAARVGDDDQAINTWIGRHPDKGLMVVLDEGTDMPPALTGALPNLEGNQPWFQCIIIGNSNSRFDLHGAMSTPAAGWTSVDPLRDQQWETTQKNGVCLFFNCYDSPAIHEVDEVRRAALSRFLITEEKIAEKAEQFGKDSDKFWRFIIGFWKNTSSDDVIISEQFLATAKVGERVEWSGLYPLTFVAGLDPAFSTGGDKTVLRLGILGIDVRGFAVLDYRREELLFPIKISALSGDDAATQVAKEVIRIMDTYGCSLGDLSVDANGQGRALAPLIQYVARSQMIPIKIYSAGAVAGLGGTWGSNGTPKAKAWDVIVRTPHDLWFSFRDFMTHGQIRGLDAITMMQMGTRLVHTERGKQKLESKLEYKKRMGAVMPSLAHSPDEADAAALVLQTAIIKHGFTPGQRRTIEQASTFEGEKLRVYRQEQQKAVELRGRAYEPPQMNFRGTLLSQAKHRRF